jgi:hypothetical protein
LAKLLKRGRGLIRVQHNATNDDVEIFVFHFAGLLYSPTAGGPRVKLGRNMPGNASRPQVPIIIGTIQYSGVKQAEMASSFVRQAVTTCQLFSVQPPLVPELSLKTTQII